MKLVKLNNLHIYFFYLFLFSIPFQTRKVFLTEYSFYSGAFTEWTTFFVYASDVFLIFACAFWLISIFKNSFCLDKKSKYQNNKFKKATKLSKVWLLLIAFLVLVTLNLAINNNYFEISVFQTVKLIELLLLVIFVYFNLKNSKILINSLFVIVFSGFLQSLIAIYQFIAQHSVFTSPILAKITGESIIGPQIPGVAKVLVDGDKIVRAYGAFPHPNILGGFLIFTTLITIYLYLEHKKDVLSSRLDMKTSSESKQALVYLYLARISKFAYTKITKFLRLFQYNNTDSIKSQGISYSLLWITLIFIQTTALFFTFSRTAWIGFLLSLLIITIFYFYNRKIVSRETISKINNNVKNTVIKFKELFIAFLLLIFLIISNFSIIQARIGDDLLSNGRLPDNSAISDRNFYNNVSRETISENFVFGSGLGTYIFQIDGYLEKNNIKQEFQSWQYQPAHNIYLLIASEIGIIGLIFFLLSVVYAISGSIKIVSPAYRAGRRETIEENYSSTDKGRLGVSPFIKGGEGDFEDSRDYNLKSNKIVSRETILNVKLNYFLIAILVSFLFIGLFDHYFWTLQQGRLMFWLVLGLMLVNSNIISKENKY